MRIVVVNLSTQVDQHHASLMTRACNIQARSHLAVSWDIFPPRVRLAAHKDDIRPGENPIFLINKPDLMGALGYHFEYPDGRPYGRVFTETILDNGTLLDGPDSVSAVLSHEVIEMLMDPWCTLWVDTPTGYEQHALEPADPVQGFAYQVMVDGVPVSVSDFVLPQWYDADPGSWMWSWDNNAKGPFQIAKGGYSIVRMHDTGEIVNRFFGNYQPPGWRMQGKMERGSRTYRRKQR